MSNDTPRRPPPLSPSLLAALVLAITAPAAAQSAASRPDAFAELGRASHVIVPQARGFSIHAPDPTTDMEIVGVHAVVGIREQTAITKLQIELRNPTGRTAEAVLLLPVPDGAVVSGFSFDGGPATTTAEVLLRDDARRLYERIVAQVRDPALLEFSGYDLIRSSVFPVPAGESRTVRVRYEHLLQRDGDRVDYLLPRSEALDGRRAWDLTFDLESTRAISTVYSPSHRLVTERQGPGRFVVRLDPAARRDPGSFRLSYLLDRGGVSASLFAYPDEKTGGGYFLLMAGLPVDADAAASRRRREVTIVIDRSGSMAGDKMDQVRAAALEVIEGLGPGEAFNIIDYGTTVASFAPTAVIKNRKTTLEARAYLTSIRPGGGTNIYGALKRTLTPPATDAMLPIALFLTDGLPTIGQTSEVDIRRMVEERNLHGRRVFTFGVGEEVNVPLLDRVARVTLATSTYVLPDEDVELKVAQVFKRLHGPVLERPNLRVTDTSGAVTTRLVHELIPAELPDLFEDDQLILLGQYRAAEAVTFELGGDFLGSPRTFRFTFDLAAADARNAFVARLWASRRIAFLIDAIRQAGAGSVERPRVVGGGIMNDPRFRELVDEILRLSTEFGILTEYTAFLAREGTDLENWNELQAGCSLNLDRRAVRTRSGLAALNQALNYERQVGQVTLNYGNAYIDESLGQVEITAVQQVCDRAFFRRGMRWIDSRLIGIHESIHPHEVIALGSPAHVALVRRLATEGRAGVLSLKGEILLELDGRILLIKGDGC